MARPTVLKFGPIILPHVHTIQRSQGALADVGRTAGGVLRSDTLRIWRKWTIRATPPAAVAAALERHLNKIMWQADEFWVLDMGEEVNIMARIDPTSWQCDVVLGRPDWRHLSFAVEEQ